MGLVAENHVPLTEDEMLWQIRGLLAFCSSEDKISTDTAVAVNLGGGNGPFCNIDTPIRELAEWARKGILAERMKRERPDGPSEGAAPLDYEPQPCCGEYDKCQRVCTPRGIEIGMRKARIESEAGADDARDARPPGYLDSMLIATQSVQIVFDSVQGAKDYLAAVQRRSATNWPAAEHK